MGTQDPQKIATRPIWMALINVYRAAAEVNCFFGLFVACFSSHADFHEMIRKSFVISRIWGRVLKIRGPPVIANSTSQWRQA